MWSHKFPIVLVIVLKIRSAFPQPSYSAKFHEGSRRCLFSAWRWQPWMIRPLLPSVTLWPLTRGSPLVFLSLRDLAPSSSLSNGRDPSRRAQVCPGPIQWRDAAWHHADRSGSLNSACGHRGGILDGVQEEQQGERVRQ